MNGRCGLRPRPRRRVQVFLMFTKYTPAVRSGVVAARDDHIACVGPMGFKRKRGKGQQGPAAKKKEWQPELVCENKRFEWYYQAQQIVPPSDWDLFMTTLKRELPSSFRICLNSGYADAIVRRLKGEFSVAPADESQENSVLRPTCLSWYPGGFGWVSTASRRHLRELPHLNNYRQFIMAEHERGGINRQEVVSMIPALLLDVQPHHVVLDMCAAPGSKTAQLLEAIQTQGQGGPVSGLVIANDANYQRAYMLVHQTKRLGSPDFLISTHEGQFFPTLYTTAVPSGPVPRVWHAGDVQDPAVGPLSADQATLATGAAMLAYYETGVVNKLQFDRILADVRSPPPSCVCVFACLCLRKTGAAVWGSLGGPHVFLFGVLYDAQVPCSGDGTLRKCPEIWVKWNPNFGAALHKLQLDIARRAVQLLKVGGMMVYSTCSLNPIENEAVVAELMRRFPGTSGDLRWVCASAAGRNRGVWCWCGRFDFIMVVVQIQVAWRL